MPVTPRDGDILPVFPLPNVILFPHMKIPLFIFEPRYRKMIEDVLKRDRLMVMSLLKRGWEWEPVSHEIGCVGHVSKIEELPSGEKNIIVHGVARVMVLGHKQVEPYIIGEIHLLQEKKLAPETEPLRRQLATLMNQYIFLKPDIPDTLIQITNMIYDAGYLADFFAYYFFPDVHTKQEILETLDTAERCNKVIQYIEMSLKELQGHAA